MSTQGPVATLLVKIKKMENNPDAHQRVEGEGHCGISPSWEKSSKFLRHSATWVTLRRQRLNEKRISFPNVTSPLVSFM